MTPGNPPRIAIIGGGASTALLLAHLARKNRTDLQVDVYDRAGKFARGVAYSTSRLCHLLNVPASNMSALADDRDHFARWAAAHGYESADFVPRKLFGDYLESVWTEAESAISVRRFQENVESCISGPGGYTLNGRLYRYAVQATGNVRPLGPAVEGAPPNYYPDPWAIDSRLKETKSVALIGSGLTAADAVLTLLDIGYENPVKIFSRHALWPMTHTAPGASWTLADARPGLPPARLMRIVRENVEAAAKQDIPWQAVVDALRPVTDDIWRGWTPAQKNSFYRHLYTLWSVHRHRMAASIARNIERAQISFIHARVKTITPEGIITQNGDFHAIGAAVNCMGYRFDEPGKRFEVSHKIGPARFGELFETVAIPEIRAQASEIAEFLNRD